MAYLTNIPIKIRPMFKPVFNTIMLSQVDAERHVTNCFCECPAGTSGVCKHISAVIYAVNTESGTSRTDEPCKWLQPQISNAGKEKYRKGKRIEELFPRRKKQKLDVDPIDIPDLKTPCILSKILSEEKKSEPMEVVKELLGHLMTDVIDIVANGECKRVITSLLVKQESRHFINDCIGTNCSTLQNEFYETHITVSKAQATDVCVQTLHQSASDLWFSERKKRISASRAHSIKTRKKEHEKLACALLNSKCFHGRGLRNVTFGTKLEQAARKKYTKLYGRTVAGCGLVIHLRQPWLCASPDGIVMVDGRPERVLEIKCPISCKNKPIVGENGEINVPYIIKNSEGNLELKENHLYFTQCQVLMYCCGLDACDFFIYTEKHTSILLEIKRNDMFLKGCLEKLQRFYFTHYLKEITSSSNNELQKSMEVVDLS